jgi:molybdate transport system substrate-binding protein
MKTFVKYIIIVTVLVGLFAFLPFVSSCSAPARVELNVSGAASLTDALKEINVLYMQENNSVTITANFASSGTLQQQIEQGAPVDVFISAASTQMNNLQDKDLILTDTRKDLLHNSVVLIVPEDSTLGITGFADLATGKVDRIAIGDPQFVPAGKYAQQTFDELGITAQIQSRLVLGNDVRQVLTYVETGNVDAGVVYATDALTSDEVTVVASAPADINAKVVYPVAVIKASQKVDAAQAYIAFLFSDQVETIFEKYGFTALSD